MVEQIPLLVKDQVAGSKPVWGIMSITFLIANVAAAVAFISSIIWFRSENRTGFTNPDHPVPYWSSAICCATTLNAAVLYTLHFLTRA